MLLAKLVLLPILAHFMDILARLNVGHFYKKKSSGLPKVYMIYLNTQRSTG